MPNGDASPLRLLLVEDDPHGLDLLPKVLAETGMACELEVIADCQEAYEALLNNRHDLCLLAGQLRMEGGTDLLKAARAGGCETPIILLLDGEAEDGCDDGDILKHGAQDGLYWDALTPSALKRSIRQVVARACIQKQLAASRAESRRHLVELERLKAALDEHAIVSVTDVQGNITYVNDRFCEISGYERAELLGRNHRMLKSGQHPAEFYEEIWDTLAKGRIWHGEVCNRRRDGGFYWVRGTIVPFTDDDGLPYQYVSIRTDITAVKESEEALRNSEERLRRSQVYANIGTWDWNIKTGDIYWSERIGPLFGYEGVVETTYENFLNALHPEDRQGVVDAVTACIERGARYDIEHRVVWPDGSVHWMLERGDVARDPDGTPSHMLGVVQDITERKQAQLKLQTSEASLANAQRIAHLGSWELDFATGELRWSDEIYRIFGHAAGAFTPSAEIFFAAVHPEDVELVKASEARARATGIHDVVHRIVRPDGSIRHVHELAEMILAGDGLPLRMTGTVQDVTERVEAEREIRASQARLANAQRIAHLGNWDYDLVSGKILWSDEVYRIFGYEPGSVSPDIQSYYEWTHTEDRALLRQTEARTLQEGKGEIVHRIVRPDGSVRHVRLIGEVSKDAGGRPLRMTGTVQDITALKQAELEQVRLAERNRALMESAYDAILIADLNGNLLDCNRHAEDLIGYSRQQLLGMHAKQLHPESELESVRESFQSIHVAGSNRARHLVRRADGSLIPVEVVATLISHEGDEFILGIFRDMSEQMQREQALHAAKEEAERANQAKSMFLSSMSHELRTPMNAILGFAQLLQMHKDLTTDQSENVEEILQAGRHLLELINEILDLAKIEAGRVDLVLEPVACCDLVRESLNLVRSMAEHYGILLREEHRVQCPVLFLADRTRLKQVVVNLLSNAIKYNRPNGSVTILLAHGQQGCARIEVTDTGRGMTPEQLDVLFQPFQRLDAGAGDIEGHGIGLAISKRLIEAMGGRIGVESTPGKGSTFWVELARATHSGEVLIAGEASGFGTAEIPPTPIPDAEFTILYVEDNPANVRLMERIIALRKNCRLIHTLDPEQGLEWASSHGPDAILLDINLPGMSGYEVLKRLRAMEKTRSIPVLAITANATVKDMERGKSAGFNDYLGKPLELSSFWSSLDTVLLARR